MEQATAGKPPPSIAINSSGGIQILNMNAVRAAAVGATVVPSPGSAQTGTVVGSPGPPGKSVGPRMISISPQMLSSRPGQPVEGSDSESVIKPSDEPKQSTDSNCCPASITGVSSDPRAANDEYEEGEIKESNEDGGGDNDNNGFVKSSDIHVEGNNRDNNHESHQQHDENDLSTSENKSVSTSGSSPVTCERSNQLPDSRPNPSDNPFQQVEIKLPGLENVHHTKISNKENCIFTPERNSPCENTDLVQVERGSHESTNIVSSLGEKHKGNQIDKLENTGSSNTICKDPIVCIYDTDVPAPIKSVVFSGADSCQNERSSPSDLALSKIENKGQICVQKNEISATEKRVENCDNVNVEKSVTTASVLEELGQSDANPKSVTEPSDLVQEGAKVDASNDILVGVGGESTISVIDPTETVDDVNLDMFSDSNDGNNNSDVPLEKRTSNPVVDHSKESPSTPANNSPINGNEKINETPPKVLGINLANIMFMDSDENQESASWNSNNTSDMYNSSVPLDTSSKMDETTSITHVEASHASPSVEHPSPVVPPTNEYTWNRSPIGGQSTDPRPSCAFQLYTVGQNNHTQTVSHQPQIAARIANRNEPRPPQYSTNVPLQVEKYSSSANHIPGATTSNPQSYQSFPGVMRNNTGESEYKANHSQSQSCFTNDPQLYSQFIQYTKCNPLAGSSDKREMQQTPTNPNHVIRNQYTIPNTQDVNSTSRSQHKPPVNSHSQIRPHIAPPHQRMSYSSQQFPSQSNLQNPNFQPSPGSHFNSNENFRPNPTTNGCDNGKQNYVNMQQVSPAYTSQSTPTNARQIIQGASFPGSIPQIPQSGQVHYVPPKDMSSCSYTSGSGAKIPISYNTGPTHLQQNYTATGQGQSYPSNYNYNNPQANRVQSSQGDIRQNVPPAVYAPPTTVSQVSNSYKPPVTWSVSGSGNQFSGLPTSTRPTIFNTNPRPPSAPHTSNYSYPSQNLSSHDSVIHRPQQSVNKLPYSDTNQYYLQGQGYSSDVRPQVPIPQRTASVISRYPNQHTHSRPAPAPVMPPSPQLLRNPQYHAQFKSPSSGNHQKQDVSPNIGQSVIRPNTSHVMVGSGTATGIGGNCSSNTSIAHPNNSGRQFYGNNQYQQSYSSLSSQNYYGNQASVIRSPQNNVGISNSSSSSNSGNSHVSSCSIVRKGDNRPGYQSASVSSGHSGEMTLQSFLSSPSAPFLSPPPSLERSASGSGYNTESGNMSWGGGTEDYPYSSCQYNDAMRRYNAPITLQALSGLQPGANHLLVKTENGQFQLVSVRMPAPTVAPGTPVVPSTAAPTTSMSIAQQLPSNSSLLPPLSHPSHQGPPGPQHPPPPSMISTTAIPSHPSQQGRIITSSSSNHIVTSWSSTPNSNVVINSAPSSSLPLSSSTAPIPHPIPHLAPPMSNSSLPHPSSALPSVIMPPNLPASNSQLLSTANNISSSSSSTFSTAAAAVAFTQQQHHRPPPPVVMSSGGPPPPVGASSLPPHPSQMTGITSSAMNSIQGSVIRSGLLGSNLPPPPPIVVSAANHTISSVTSSTPIGAGAIPHTNLSTTLNSATIRLQQPISQVPNNNATSNVQSGMGMMMTASNSMSIQPHQIHPQYSPHPQAQAPHPYSSNAIASNTASTVSQMSNETAKNKCKNFLSFLLELSAKQNQTVARNVKNLIQGLIDGKVNEDNFADRLQKEVNSQPQPCLVGFLKKSLPHLRHSLATSELKIDGIKPPPMSFVPQIPAPVSALVPQIPPIVADRKPSKGGASKSKSHSSSNNAAAACASSAFSGPGAPSLSKSSIPSTPKSSKDKEKKDKAFISSGYSADDDINDVAAMGGVNLAEESQRILGSTEFVGTQIRSCRDETLIQASPIASKFKIVAARYGLEETPNQDVAALLSHAVEERLKTVIEKLSVIAEHRMDVIKLDDRYEVTQDVKGQLRFLEELDKLEKKRHDEQEREMLIRAAKSRSKSEDPEQAKLKAKAKEMQRVALEEMRQRDANLTALQAIGPRKKPKLDTIGGSHGSAVPSPLGSSGASSSLGRPQMALRPRLKRVNLRDLLFLLEHDKETMRSPFLYRNLMLK